MGPDRLDRHVAAAATGGGSAFRSASRQNGRVSTQVTGADSSSEHVRCQPGCFQATDTGRLKARAAQLKIDLRDLIDLIAATDGTCMICRRCHASMVDRGRVGSTVRGIVCKWCRTRLSIADGAAGNLGREATAACLCNPGEDDWLARISLATAHYLDRAARSTSQNVTPRVAFAQLVVEVRANGVDPVGAWTKTSDEIPSRAVITPARAGTSGDHAASRRVPPLRRDPCAPECLAHDEHVYVACFDEPTLVADRDHHPADAERNYPVRHYVGWTTQQPPVKRLRQHGAACLSNLILLVPGSTRDEFLLKGLGRCPRCNGALWYYLAENLAPLRC